jgi:photosystem II stability/assembly factor-like uncharacterized protein
VSARRAACAGALACLAGSLLAQAPSPSPQAPLEPVVTSLTIFAGTAQTLWRTKDWGSTWERVAGPPSKPEQEPLSEVRALHVYGTRVYAGGAGGLLISEDFGSTWTRLLEKETLLAVLPSRYPQSDPTVFVGTANGLFRTRDGGKTLEPTAVVGTPVYRIEWPGPALVLATGRGVLVSSDAGATVGDAGVGQELRALVVSSFFQLDPSMLAGGKGGVHFSADGGKTWRPAGLEGRDVTDLAWLGPIVYAATDVGVQRSDDLGKSWVPMNQGLQPGKVRRLLFPLMPDSGAVIFAATDHGVYRSDDAGQNWRFAGMKGEDVIALATFPAPERARSRRR